MNTPPAPPSPATSDPRVRELVAWAQSGGRHAGSEANAALAALAGSLPRQCAAAPLAMVAAAAYARMPGRGPRDLRTGHVAVDLLGRLGEPGARELVRLQQRIRYHHPRVRIARALDAVQQELRILPGELEDTFGGPELTPELTLELRVGRHVAVVAVSDDLVRVGTSWRTEEGRALRSRPQRASDDPEALAAVDLERRRLRRHLGDVRQRFEQTMLEEPLWTADQWTGRMFADPLRAAMARRLVWRIQDDRGDRLALPGGAGLEDVRGRRVPLEAGSLVSLWHPAQNPDAQPAWRGRLDTLGLQQPVEQVRRDIVLPDTDVWDRLDAVAPADQIPLRGFLRNRCWNVPYIGLFDATPHASRKLTPRGPHALLGLEPIPGDARRLAVGPLSFVALGSALDPRELPAALVSEAGRDVLGALWAAGADA